jgi:hypothetical protein
MNTTHEQQLNNQKKKLPVDPPGELSFLSIPENAAEMPPDAAINNANAVGKFHARLGSSF